MDSLKVARDEGEGWMCGRLDTIKMTYIRRLRPHGTMLEERGDIELYLICFQFGLAKTYSEGGVLGLSSYLHR